jgi:hypothetical protein
MIILIIILGLIFGYVWVQFAFPQVTSIFDLTESQWTKLGIITSLGTFAFALGAGLLLIIELNEMTDSRNLAIYQDIYEKFMTDDAIQARKHIYIKIPTSDDHQVVIDAVLGDEETKYRVKQVLNLFDYFGFLTDQDWVTGENMIGWVSPIVVKIWDKIEPVVEYERSQRPEEPDYYAAAIRLAKMCKNWRDKNFPKRSKEIIYNANRL